MTTKDIGTELPEAVNPAPCNPAHPPNTDFDPAPKTQSELQKTFVAMLFAFVAATVAQQLGEILVVATKAWRLANSAPEMWSAVRGDGWLLAVGLLHAMLALVMVTVSWISWSRSQAGMHKKDIDSVFSRKFIIFLVEIFLVTLYFSISKSAETDFSAYLKDGRTSSFVKNPSARPESLQILWVFVTFAAWDYLVDVVRPCSWRTLRPLSVFNHLRKVFAFCGVSLFCAVLAYLVSIYTPASGGTALQVAFGDLALIACVFLFIAAKPFEYFLTQGMSKELTGDVTLREHPSSTEKRRFWFLLTLVLLCILMTRSAPCILG